MTSSAKRIIILLATISEICFVRGGVAQAPSAASMSGPTSVPFDPGSIAGMVRYKDRAYILLEAIWRTPYIPVCWEAGVPPGIERSWVRDAVKNSWESPNSKLSFIGWGDCASASTGAHLVGVRIVVVDDGDDDGPQTRGLGTQIDGKPNGMVLNFTFKTWYQDCADSEAKRQSCIRAIAVHEFGHALGFAHEQNRPDTPGECAKKKLKQGDNGDSPLSLTPWDEHSVMNYCNPVAYNGGVLSAYDLVALKQYYGT